jgi:hypothetical protein
MSLGLSEATTLEEYHAIRRAKLQGVTELVDVANELQEYRKTYENKFKIQDSYGVFGPTIQEFVTTSIAAPVPSQVDDLLALIFNDIYGEDIATEFLSYDIPKTETYTGLQDFVIENLGQYSVTAGQLQDYMKARDMAKDFVVKKSLGDVNIVTYSYLSAPTDVMKQQVVDATQLLLSLRIHSMINPIAPRADIDRLGDKLERTIENYFSDNKEPDPDMEMYGKSKFFSGFTGIKELQGNLMPDEGIEKIMGKLYAEDLKKKNQ